MRRILATIVMTLIMGFVGFVIAIVFWPLLLVMGAILIPIIMLVWAIDVLDEKS